MPISKTLQENFISAAREVAQEQLVSCGSGNLSCRIDREQMLITTSGSWMSDISDDTIALCRIADGQSLNDKKPSVEIGFHRRIVQQRQDIDVVLHFQSPYATILACRNTPTQNFCIIPEIPRYIGPVATVPYINPGSDELAQAVAAAMLEHDMAMLQNHGQVTVGKNFREALQRAIFFELACKILVYSGEQAQTLPKDGIEYLAQAYKKK
ncbi:aldolase [candidate division KSB3 bacterium]|uniref:Aldolase n=1 Tax=candidate division KSB3 bacterium TaxID=2044937 RepID=A0A2G6K872_9BACT|nr:MAG: aldolase [candidate division KSB3 bacterium]